ncbi:MAG TPA: MBL fold metallo-hydrolase [Acidimicrobiia bacterium]
MPRTTTATALAGRLGTADEPFVLDVRTPEEHDEWRIPGAANVPLDDLATHLEELPHDREIVVHCAGGNRSTQAAVALEHAGFDVTELAGGIAEWGRVYDQAELEADGAVVVQVRRRGKGCLSYVIGAGGEAFVVDPSTDVDRYLRLAREHGWRITRVFDTHLHADHVSGARALAEAAGAALHLNPADAFDFEFTPLADGDAFALPDGPLVGVSVLHTPGHTEGSTIYRVGDRAVLTGDTLFVDGVGRPDLAEKAEQFAHNLYRSLRERVLVLPDDALVLPAHYGDEVAVRPGEPVGAALGDLRRRLRPLALDEEEFVDWASSATAPRPPNYAEIVLANMGRSTLGDEALEELEAGPNRCSVAS